MHNVYGYTNIFFTPRGILTSDIHCILRTGYKNIVCMFYNRYPLYYVHIYIYILNSIKDFDLVSNEIRIQKLKLHQFAKGS